MVFRRQRKLAQDQADARAQSSNANVLLVDDTERIQKAQDSMSMQLQKVEQERKNVEEAVNALKTARHELDQNFIIRLKAGGIPKQVSLAGLVLFGARSMLDSVTAVYTGDETVLEVALVQGAIAFVCAIAFFLL